MAKTKLTSIVVLTGAGISAPSGIPVFRGSSGLWNDCKIEDVATYDGFLRNKQYVHDFYNKMRLQVQSKKPNAAHIALTRLQQACKEQKLEFSLITQNIDDLHEKALSEDVIHMHGSLNSILCEHCGSRYAFLDSSSIHSECKVCKHQSLRPDIVWFGEMPYYMDIIEQKLKSCDLFLAIGTSGAVYPAASFCQIASYAKAHCIEFNLEKSLVANNFATGFYQDASISVPNFVDKLIKSSFNLTKALALRVQVI